MFIDAIVVKIRDGQVANRPVYTAIGVNVAGERDILGLWVGDGGEGAKFWFQVFTELRNRGVEDVCMVVCDGLKGLPEAVGNTWPLAIVQTCVLHLIHNTFRFTSKADWDKMARDLRPVYTEVSEHEAKERFVDFTGVWVRNTRRSSGSGRTPGPSSCLLGLLTRDQKDHQLDECCGVARTRWCRQWRVHRNGRATQSTTPFSLSWAQTPPP